MSHTFLMEIGLEEIPAHVVTPSAAQLVEKTEKFLKEQRMDFDEVQTYSTPRRLTVKVTGLADKQPDIQEEAKGPAKKIAYDKDGNWSKAAQGFARGQGVSVDDIFFKELKGTEYVYVKKFIEGKAAADVMQGMRDVAMDLKFPTMMRWGTNDFQYVRPIRWIVAMLDDQVIPLKILNIESGNVSQGHRFLGKPVELKSADDYVEALRAEKVIVDAAERKSMIRAQINDLAQKNNWKIVIDEDLLEEVNNLVEYPTVFAGSFDEKYLSVPDQVLITSMKDHQRFFYVTDQNGKLLPNFVSVRNGNTEYLENVVQGNEKVLTARLEDAKFFYEEDQKQSIADYVERLKKVMFHDKIGTIYEKMARVRLLAAQIGKFVGLNDQELADLDRAAQIYKFDLVTGMVGEFAELQGVMGEIYARLQGENDNVAVAIREEYMPTSAEGELPATKVGAVLSIADKIDSIQAFFAAGMIPSGSNDPYALRRQALGIVRIALARNWKLSVPMMLKFVENAMNERPDLYKNIMPGDEQKDMQQFIIDRLAQIMNGDKQLRHDVLDTVVANPENAFVDIEEAAKILGKHLEDDDFKETIEALTRVGRMAKKAPNFEDDAVLKAELFENESEKKLAEAVKKVATAFEQADLEEKFNQLASLKDPITDYFDSTMIMAKDEDVKQNRLLQLKQIADLTKDFGELDNLNVK
ncbi:glycine--tRNA ligase subunit beta [Ligilactobacillus aviarius]|uniref:Glycine--tRNA ligase beta subunit n=1 Tax=Ligilactobacillus aviarius TaxID=1606 RepID=A0A179CMR4_9LACO|nr:glycine--tRNA ligase subunit beta [Ligilactobacillus aviarius]OAP97772.1 glycine--tRNA ligase subunit beta [Ligilactobacillus aviarius]OAP99637.1 glycine--tRNA ligase subunit beta [Ligilactobacillus aviarius]OAQ00039.1 glycine--tRNA ligase subunit beta [Ligilactobacillus aviarius]OAQ04276.1 glycine--tRNA ligase subunit beta [Ligilactobacillus aviarius]OAQ06870.1 glycine--tRNA ligase subunit beta [Ligilactobacillus aviarius]